MPGVASDIFKVIVFATRADALLRIHRPGPRAASRAEEDILELIHAGVGEEQRRVVVRDDRAARDNGVAGPVLKEVQIGLADGGGAHAIGGLRLHGGSSLVV